MARKTGTREQWLKARLALLKEEKKLTRLSDELARKRRELPWVPVEKEYRFATEDGKASLAELFRGRSQLIVYHFMFGPDYKAGCPSCSAVADGFNGFVPHLENHDVKFWAVSLAPLPKLLEYRKRMGWTFPWASSEGGGFNRDFNVTFTEEEQRSGAAEYNYRKMPAASARAKKTAEEKAAGEFMEKIAAPSGVSWAAYSRQAPGMSAFALEDGVVHHVYSAYARGLDALWGMYQWLDRAPLGRNETGLWLRRRDEY